MERKDAGRTGGGAGSRLMMCYAVSVVTLDLLILVVLGFALLALYIKEGKQ